MTRKRSFLQLMSPRVPNSGSFFPADYKFSGASLPKPFILVTAFPSHTKIMASLTIMIIIILLLQYNTSFAKDNDHESSCSSSCGNIHNITSPFRLTTDPLSCGDLRYNLSCENNQTVLYLPTYNWVLEEIEYQRLYVQTINYNNYTIRLADPNIWKDDCSSFPNNTLSTDTRFYDGNDDIYENTYNLGARYAYRELTEAVILFNCESPVLDPSYASAAPCTFDHAFSSERTASQSYYSYYYVLEGDLAASELKPGCWMEQSTLISKRENNSSTRRNSRDIQNALVYGFELSWIQSFQPRRENYYGYCYIDNEDSNKVRCTSDVRVPNLGRNVFDKICGLFRLIWFQLQEYYLYEGGLEQGIRVAVGVFALRTAVGISFVIGLLVYKWRRRHLSLHDGVEEFLQNHTNLMPIRYSYREIRKMSKGFKEKLGEGGFGSVYWGKLASGAFVAIKMLGKSKANGQDFINEVATIGRIHHVNVVRLVGFCVEGSNRALVYDFMPNGSLDKYIFSREGVHNSLTFEKIFEISLGVARGIEYLHRGCDMQILHFDIKPHNILLDENFIPKVSDFGLARLCPLHNNIVSLTAARGTIGYIAPELFYKNIGGVSYKADVYSFGMLLMEMAHQRKNVDANAEKSSQIFFPSWVHEQFNKGDGVEIEDATEEESRIIHKMMLVSLWCIQLKPCDRPSMNKVIEMLEGEFECLQIPPNLYLYPQAQELEKHDVADATKSSWSTIQSEEDSAEASLISNSY